MELFQESQWIFLVLSLLGLGCLAGFLAGLLGVGGGVVLVPGLFYVFSALGYSSDTLMHVCVGTSLAVIVPTGLASAIAHYKAGNTDVRLLRQIGAGIIAGVIAGTLLADSLAGRTLQLIFASIIFVLALVMLSNFKEYHISERMPAPFWQNVTGSLIGAVSTLIGIGGATMNVPFMTLFGVPIHRAIGTAAALGLCISVPGAAGFFLIGLDEPGRPPFSAGFVNLPAWLIIILTSMIMARLGAYTAHQIPVGLMRKGFAVFMILISIKLGSDLL